MTTLEAVQQIVSRAGRGAPSALSTGQFTDAGHAERLLDEEDLRIQGMGWHYNIRYDVTLSPNGSNNIVLPDGTIVIDSYGQSGDRNVTQVGQRLYDLDDNTFTLTGDLKVKYTTRYDFDCIPDPIQRYIMLSAAARFNEEYGDPDMRIRDRKQQFIERDLREAKMNANRFEADTDDTNPLRTYGAMRVRGVLPTGSGAHGHNL